MPQIQSGSFIVRPATTDDAEAIVNLINACSIEQGIKERDTEQGIRAMMKMPGLNLETDTLLVIDQRERVVGCALDQDNPPNALLLALAEVHPQHRGKGVGTVLCNWIEDRAVQAMSRLLADTRVTLLQKRSSNDKASQDLLLKQGYQVVRHNFRMLIEMYSPPPQPTIPAGILIRPFIREEEGRPMVQAICEAFRDNWGYVERPFEVEYQRCLHILDSGQEPETARF
jgi:mycothiol synthase